MDTKRKSTTEVRHLAKQPASRFRSVMARLTSLCFLSLLMTFGGLNSFGQGVGISEVSIVPHSSSILELRHESGPFKGLLIPRMTTAQRLSIDITDADPTGEPAGLIVYDTETFSFWYWDGFWRSMAASQFGASNQLLGMNEAGDANEYKTLSGTLNQINVAHTAGSIMLSTPQDIHEGANPQFVGMTLTGLTANSGVYTDGSNKLTSAPPSGGTIGYWNRNGSILSPSNPGDAITTSGNIYTTGTGSITSAGLLTGQSGLAVSGGNVTVADGATTTSIYNNTINLGNANDDVINIQGVTGVTGNSLTIGSAVTNLNSATTNVTGAVINVNSSAINLGDVVTDDLTINASILNQADASGNALTFEGATSDDIVTSFIITDPQTTSKEITFPDRSGTVVLSGSGTTFQSNLAVSTDANGQLVNAVNDQPFNVNSNVINLGNAAADQITAVGNIDAQNGLDVTGADLTVATNSDLNGTLDVAGQVVLAASGVSTTVRGSLNVSEATDLDNTLNVDGATTLNGNTSITGASTFTTATGQVTFGGNVDAQSGVDVTSGDVNITEDLYVTGTADIDGAVNLASTGESTTVEGTLQVDEAANFDGATTFTDAVTLGNAESDAISIDGTVQEGTLIAGQSGLVFDGSTADANRTTFNITEPSQSNIINFPDRSGTVVLSGSGTTLENNLAVSTDAIGQLVNAVDDQPFNVNSNLISLGNTAGDQITATGNIDAQNGLDVSGADLTVATNSDLNGTLDVAGQVALAASGVSTTVRGSLNVDGSTTLNGNVTLGDNITDAVTISGTVGGFTTDSDIVFEELTNNMTLAGTDQTTDATTFSFPDVSGGSATLAITDDITSALTDVVLRDGTQAMTGDLNLGNNSIINATNITASGTIQGGTFTDGTLSINGGAITSATSVTASGALSGGSLTTTGSLNVDGSTTLNGNVTLGDNITDAVTINGTMQGATPLVFNAGNNTTTFAIGATGTDKTITFPDASGTVVLAGGGVTGNRALASDASGQMVASGVTDTELNVLSGITSTTGELNYLDITAAGTAEATKAMVTDANLDIDMGVGDITATDIIAKGTTTLNGAFNYALSTGFSNDLIVSLDPPPAAYVTGMIILVQPNLDSNVGPITIDVNGLGPQSVVNNEGGDPGTDALMANGMYFIAYNGTNFVILNPSPSPSP